MRPPSIPIGDCFVDSDVRRNVPHRAAVLRLRRRDFVMCSDLAQNQRIDRRHACERLELREFVSGDKQTALRGFEAGFEDDSLLQSRMPETHR